MASLQRVSAFLQVQNSLVITKRFRGKVNIQKPKPAHFDKQLLLDLTKPVYSVPKSLIPEVTLCRKHIQKFKTIEEDNPFERILANECLDWFNKSKMVIFLHLNSISMEDKMPVFASLRKNDMHLRTYGKKIVNMATKGTRYEVVTQLFTSHQNVIFGQPDNIGKMFKILKKTPQLVVMAGIVHDKLMSKNELVKFSELPSLELARSQLCGVLNSAGSCIVQQLQQSQQTLVAHLDKHVEINSTPTESKPTESIPTDTKE